MHERAARRLDPQLLVDVARVVRLALLEDERDLAHIGDVPRRIAVHQDEIGPLPGLEIHRHSLDDVVGAVKLHPSRFGPDAPIVE